MNPKINNFQLIIFFVFAFGLNVGAYSQSVEEKVSYTQKNEDSSEYSYKRKYLYLDLKMKEEKNLISIGIAPTTMFSDEGERKFNFSMNMKYDRKIIPSFSTYAEVVGNYNYSKKYTYFSEASAFKIALNLGVRYYFMQKKNLRLKIAASNFNGPYLDFKFNGLMDYISYKLKDVTYPVHNSDTTPLIKDHQFELHDFKSFTFSWGYQHKINNYLYMDGCVFLIRNKEGEFYYFFDDYPRWWGDMPQYHFMIGFSFKFGLNYGWK
jgi:hypothetical protein